MKINYEDLSKQIVDLVGGEKNISAITHCVTRLRFYLKNKDIAKDNEIKDLKGVLGVVYGNGQYQVILGEHLFPVYDYIVKTYNVDTEEAIDENLDGDLVSSQKKDVKYYFNKTINFMAQALTPFITVIYGAGMLRVVLSLLSYFFPDITGGTTYQILNIFSNAPFYFMPVLVAYGTSRVLKSNPVFAMTIALGLLSPDFTALMGGENPVTMLAMPVQMITYANTLLPGIFVGIMCSYLERWFYRIIPGLLRSVFAPLCIFLVGIPVTVLVLGPIGNIVGSWIVMGIVWLQAHVGGFAPGVIAAAHPFLVMLGVNMLMVGPMTELLSRVGYDNVFRPGWILHNVAEGGSCLAVACKTKDKDLKTTALSAGIGALVSGVSEPALYGVNLKLRKPMYGLVLGAFAGGSVAGFMGAKAFTMGYSSVLGVVIFESTIAAIVSGILVGFLVSFVVTFAVYKDPKVSTKQVKNTDEKLCLALERN